MPVWLIWYSGMYFEIRLFFSMLAAILLFFIAYSITSVDKKTSKNIILYTVVGWLIFSSLALLLPDGKTAISMYNAL